jgi:hypothetical protein
VENQQIVSFELNQPWKYCYETGIKECQNPLQINPKGKNPSRRSYVVFCEPLGDRWDSYTRSIIQVLAMAYGFNLSKKQ